MITEKELDHFRLSGKKVRVQRDNNPANDVVGIVVAWDDKKVMIRKQNRRILQLPRYYVYTEWSKEQKPDKTDEDFGENLKE